MHAKARLEARLREQQQAKALKECTFNNAMNELDQHIYKAEDEHLPTAGALRVIHNILHNLIKEQ